MVLAVHSHDNTVPEPLAMNRRWTGEGPDGTGLVVTVWERVKSFDGQSYYIDDGSALLRLSGVNIGLPGADSFVIATGIWGMESVNGENVPVIRARKSGDMITR